MCVYYVCKHICLNIYIMNMSVNTRMSIIIEQLFIFNILILYFSIICLIVSKSFLYYFIFNNLLLLLLYILLLVTILMMKW